MLDGIELITKAFEKRNEEKAFQLYASKYANMNKDNFIPFNEFYNPKKPIDSNKPVQDILSDVKAILDGNKGRWTQ